MRDTTTTMVKVTVVVSVEHGSALTREQVLKEASSCVGKNRSWSGYDGTYCHTEQLHHLRMIEVLD